MKTVLTLMIGLLLGTSPALASYTAISCEGYVLDAAGQRLDHPCPGTVGECEVTIKNDTSWPINGLTLDFSVTHQNGEVDSATIQTGTNLAPGETTSIDYYARLLRDEQWASINVKYYGNWVIWGRTFRYVASYGSAIYADEGCPAQCE